MKINHIQIKNFYSVREIDLKIDKLKGIVLVEGENKDTGGSNGAGKSVILEAIVWGLFGRTIRKSNEAAMVNTDAEKDCNVTVRLTTDKGQKVIISRSRRPTSLSLEVDGEAWTRDHATATQHEIDAVLQTNYKVFMASIVFGQHNNLDFISASPDDKRIILRNFLHLEDMFKRRDKIKSFKSEYQQIVKSADSVIIELEKQNEGLTIKSQNILQGFDIKDLPSITLEEILDAERRIRDLLDKIREENIYQKQRLHTIKDLKYKFNLGVYVEESKCNACGSAVEEIQTKEHLDAIELYLDVTETSYDKACQNIKELEGHIADLEPEISSIEYSKKKTKIEAVPKAKMMMDLIKTNTTRIEELQVERREAKTKYEVMRFWERAFSEQGLIKYVIRNILDYFNSQCNQFLSPISSGQFYIKFDEELKETIHTNGRQVQHISLSGGEKRKVNIAVLLALHSLLNLTGKSQSDLLFFDEIAENLDTDGLYGLYILLTEIKKDKTIFLITHNNYLKSLVENDSILKITKKNGESFIAKEQ